MFAELSSDTTTKHLPWGLRPFSGHKLAAATYLGFTKPELCCPHRVSHPLKALLRCEPPGPVSCRFRSWGSPFEAHPFTLQTGLATQPCPHDVSSESIHTTVRRRPQHFPGCWGSRRAVGHDPLSSPTFRAFINAKVSRPRQRFRLLGERVGLRGLCPP